MNETGVCIVIGDAGQGNKAVSKTFVNLEFVACDFLASIVVASVNWLTPLKVEVVSFRWVQRFSVGVSKVDCWTVGNDLHIKWF